MTDPEDDHQSLNDVITVRSGIDFNTCLHCRTCANGCPFLEGMDYHPHAVIRLIQLGMEEQVLKSSTIWICVGCNTCSSGCPMAIDIPAIMDVLRQKALEQKIKIPEPDILQFHTQVLNTVKKYGRTHKLEIMMRYKLSTMDLLSDMGMGLKMLKKRKLDLTPSKIEDKKALAKIFKKK
ncbi:MAG: 4Fe-4S dicluster domain-containing protein [Pseudomonadota bacterium]